MEMPAQRGSGPLQPAEQEGPERWGGWWQFVTCWAEVSSRQPPCRQCQPVRAAGQHWVTLPRPPMRVELHLLTALGALTGLHCLDQHHTGHPPLPMGPRAV